MIIYLEVAAAISTGFLLGAFFKFKRKFLGGLSLMWILPVLADPLIWNLLYLPWPVPYHILFWPSLLLNTLIITLFTLSLLLGRTLF